MSHHKSYSVGSIPFSWENQPGIAKVTPEGEESPSPEHFIRLPPPPGKSDSPKMASHGLHVPLPPCIFQPSLRSLSRKGSKKKDDPFLAAYMECTSSSVRSTQGRITHKEKKRKGLIGLFSCKSSTSVREKAMVRLSQLPEARDRVGRDRRPQT